MQRQTVADGHVARESQNRTRIKVSWAASVVVHEEELVAQGRDPVATESKRRELQFWSISSAGVAGRE